MSAPALRPGLHKGIPMADYLALEALGSGRLGWLAVSPLHYKYMLTQPRQDTEATARGTALHMAVLEPELFEQRYVCEPDPAAVAPGNAKPRATNAYRGAVDQLRASGRTVLKTEMMEAVLGMAVSVRAHPQAMAVLRRAPDREVTAVWMRAGVLCRGRIDMLGLDVAGDLKTTRSLATFSPWEITKLGYHIQAAHYEHGLRWLGREINYFFFIAVESTAPYDVGVFVLDRPFIELAQIKVAELLDRLVECEASGTWPGQFPDVVPATITDAAVAAITEVE